MIEVEAILRYSDFMWSQDEYTRAWLFACKAHKGQSLPGSDIPYVNHIANVSMEVMTALAVEKVPRDYDLAIACALLHDTIEDTGVTFNKLEETFGKGIALGVLALSKSKDGNSKFARMLDSLERIQNQPHEVWMVKLADRIVNLQPPPATWSAEKIKLYYEESFIIHHRLRAASAYLEERLLSKIHQYYRHIDTIENTLFRYYLLDDVPIEFDVEKDIFQKMYGEHQRVLIRDTASIDRIKQEGRVLSRSEALRASKIVFNYQGRLAYYHWGEDRIYLENDFEYRIWPIPVTSFPEIESKVWLVQRAFTDEECCTSGNFNFKLKTRKYLGTDPFNGEYSLEQCTSCGRLWCVYAYERAAFTGSGRWLHALLDDGQARPVDTESCREAITMSSLIFSGGCYFFGAISKIEGKSALRLMENP